MLAVSTFCERNLNYAVEGLVTVADGVSNLSEGVRPGFEQRHIKVQNYALFGTCRNEYFLPNLTDAALDALIGVVVRPILGLLGQIAGVICLIRAPFAAVCQLITIGRREAIAELAEMRSHAELICVSALNCIPGIGFIFLGIYAARTQVNLGNPELRQPRAPYTLNLN